MPRRRMLDTFETAATLGPYDEYPVLTDDVDPQLHLSRNDRAQPFYLTCEKDCMLVQMSGKAKLELKDSSVRYFELVPGDYVYVPGGTAHRMSPGEASTQYRYKAREAGLEAVTFCCDECDEVLHTQTWDTAEELPQTAYLRAVTDYNGDAAMRRCSKCNHANPAVDLTDYRWEAVAQELAEPQAEDAW